MAVFSGTIYSDTLKMETTLHAVLTGDMRTERGCKPLTPGLAGKTLILLHGLSGNGAGWLYYMPVFRLAEQYGLRIILPDGHRSFYQDMVYGGRYFTYIADELPHLAQALFGADVSPQNLMIAGLSMGGYGALRCALTHPHRYAYAGAFSAPVQLQEFVTSEKEVALRGLDKERIGWFGPEYQVPPESDVFSLAQQIRKPPPLFLACGKQDAFYGANRYFAHHLSGLGFQREWFEQNGEHDWPFWETALTQFLKFCAAGSSANSPGCSAN